MLPFTEDLNLFMLRPLCLCLGLCLVFGLLGLALPPAHAAKNKGFQDIDCFVGLGLTSTKKRILHFPPDYSLGDLRIYTLWRPRDAWEEGTRGPARGTIVVPPGSMVMFVPGPRFYKNPEIINTIAADGIDSIQFSSTSLDDSEDGMCDRALCGLGRLKSVVEVNLDKSDASDVGAVHAAELPNLRRLTAMGASIDGTCLKQLAQLQQLRCLHLPRNKLKQENLKYLAAMPRLEMLHLGHCNLSDAGVKNLAGCTHLTYLSIGDNPEVTDQSINYLLALKNLRTLALYQTSITAKGVLALRALHLTRLELPSNNITEKELASISAAFPRTEIKVSRVHSKPVDSYTKTIFGPLH